MSFHDDLRILSVRPELSRTSTNQSITLGFYSVIFMLARTKVTWKERDAEMRTARPIRTSKSLDRDGQDPLLPAPKKRKHSDQWWWLSLRNETGSTAMYLLQDQYYCDREQSINHAKYIRSLESHAAHARKNDKIYQKCIAKRYTRYLQRCLIDSDKFTWLNATQTWSWEGESGTPPPDFLPSSQR
jgi:hypothetical protein